MKNKTTLGLDLGTNSIGWALVDNVANKILGMGSRIIPMGVDKLNYEKGIGITKNADRRIARTIRRMNKRYKVRRNKLLFILAELEMLPEQFRFRNGLPGPTKLQDLELLPIPKGTLQLNSVQHYELRVRALSERVCLQDLGKILYKFNQLRGYAGGGSDDNNKKDQSDSEEPEKKKTYEVFTQKVDILSIVKSDRAFKIKGGKNKGQELPIFDIIISLEGNEKEGTTILQNLEAGKTEELEVRIKQTKDGENIVVALPQKTNWRKKMEATEEILKGGNLFVSQLILKDLRDQGKWTKIRNRVILRNRYQQEFDAIWDEQAKHYPLLNNCPKEKLQVIANYLYPGGAESQAQLKQEAIDGGLKHIIKEQVIYYQRPLKSQAERVSECRFEKGEKVLPTSHPLFQEFRCWDQINRMYVTAKAETYDERKQKKIYQYTDRYLTPKEKWTIYEKLQNQKQLGFSEVAKIIDLKTDKTEYLNGLHVKAKLKGCDTQISIKNEFKYLPRGNSFDEITKKNHAFVVNIWHILYYQTGNEYDPKSSKVSSLKAILQNHLDEEQAELLALKMAQNISYPKKYGSLSGKAINNILPLMCCQPVVLNDAIQGKLDMIKRTIQTGEIDENGDIEPYMVTYMDNNPNILHTGGMMFAFAASLIYGRHTTNNVRPTIHHHYEIKYNPNWNLRNPVVEQLVNEAMQIIKALWKQYKLDTSNLEIKIELARDLKNSAGEREKIYKAQIENQKQNSRIKERLQEAKIPTTDENIIKYKLYEQQKCLSPYSGSILELSKFDQYEIDHIVPQSRLFDDSFANKVLVEGDLNSEKSNRTAWEYITQQTTRYKLYTVESYLKNVNENFFGKKKKNLLLEKIPTNFIERQIKDTQYISVAVKNELAKVVGSENVRSTSGEITNYLRSRWGLKKMLMKITEPRFTQMRLWDPSKEWVKEYFDKEKRKPIYEIEHWSKRYDHRHHAIDALIVALTEQKHIQRLNNLNKELQDWLTKNKDRIQLEVNEDENILEAYFNLEENRRVRIQEQIEGFRKFDPPFDDLVVQAKELVKTMIVSHKPKDNLSIQFSYKTGRKELKIRAALHEATLYGKHKGQDIKTEDIGNLALKDIAKVVDPILRLEIEAHRIKKEYGSMKEAFTGEGLKAFNENRLDRSGNKKPPVSKLKIYYSAKEQKESSLQRLYQGNDKLSVKTGDNYLFLIMEKEGKKGRERVFDIVSLYDAAQIAKVEWNNKNENFKQAIFSYCLKENNANTLLFSLQQNELVYLPEDADDPVPQFQNDQQFQSWLFIKENKERFCKRVYKVVKFTGKDCFFIPHNYSTTISVAKSLTEEQKLNLKRKYGEKKIPKKELNFEEFGSYGTSAKTEVNEDFVKALIGDPAIREPLKIQDHCIKLQTDWIGNIKLC